MVPPVLVGVEEESADVTKVLVGREGVGVLWVTVNVAVMEGDVAEVVGPLAVAWV